MKSCLKTVFINYQVLSGVRQGLGGTLITKFTLSKLNTIKFTSHTYAGDHGLRELSGQLPSIQ
jgi:hypothetical protein